MVFQAIDPNAAVATDKRASGTLSRADEILLHNQKELEDVIQQQKQKNNEERPSAEGSNNIRNTLYSGTFRAVDLKKIQPFETKKSDPTKDDESVNELKSKVCLKILSQDLLLDNINWNVLSNKFINPPPFIGLNLDVTSPDQCALSYCCSDDESEENSPMFNPYSAVESQDYMYESTFPRLPEKNLQYENDERFELVGAIWNEQYDPKASKGCSPALVPLEKEDVNIAGEISTNLEKKVSNIATQMLMPGIPVMIQGGDFSGNFGLIESSYDDYCEVNIFVRQSCENQLSNVEKNFLAPIIPNQDMKLTVTFEEDAEVYFCPRDAVKSEESSEFKWIGMKTWCVMNPILNLAIPEGSNLEKINDIELDYNLEFSKIQEQLDTVEPPYSMTFQFPSGVQQIKMDELYTSDVSINASEENENSEID